jgi:hypothetical protein
MNTHFQPLTNPQSTAVILAHIVTATTALFRRKEPAIPGLVVSDSTWEDWEEAINEDHRAESSDLGISVAAKQRNWFIQNHLDFDN